MSNTWVCFRFAAFSLSDAAGVGVGVGVGVGSGLVLREEGRRRGVEREACGGVGEGLRHGRDFT